jgi:hypothetical protein
VNAFPEIIKVKIMGAKDCKPIPNIAVNMTLFARHKNNYHLTLFSDENGNIEITKDMMNNKIDMTRNFWIMDFSSKLNDCEPRLLFSVLDEEWVVGAIKTGRRYLNSLGITQEYLDKLSQVDNYKYLAISKTIELSGEKVVEVELKLTEVK